MAEVRVAMVDEEADLLDDLAYIAAHWKRHRDNGHTPRAIRSALIMIAKEIAAPKSEVIDDGRD